MAAFLSIDFGELLLDSVIDTAKMLPFLFAAYLIIEWLERKKSDSIEGVLAKGGRFGFVPGAFLGLLPQCGFSAAAANFYASRVISLGTLMAVFLATSDEAIPVMLGQPDSYPSMVKLLGFKLVHALLVGFLLDVALRRFIPKSMRGYGADKICLSDGTGEHHHEEEGGILVSALKHTAVIFVTIFAFTFVFGLLVAWLGEENIAGFLAGLGFFQPLVAALFGLIPNCASSVLLTQLYLSGGITFGSVLAGLSANAGIGLTVLFRANKNPRQNLFITGLLVGLGTLLGLVVQGLGVA